ncbi:MAG TPA: acyl-CoA reductase, partial [Bacteroidetes bacterium]|nr:acyl-CoA reductase [Bacteroidota bacterium]
MRSYPTLEALLRVKEEFTRSVELEDVPYYRASQENAWFTKPQINHRIQCINDGLLQDSTMKEFIVSCKDTPQSKTIALIPSGNIPLSFASDLICILLAGHNALVKPSSKDSVFTAYFIELINRHLPNRVLLTSDRISSYDASIATGSDQAQPYFTRYFGNKPHVFRRNRRSVGILRGKESQSDFEKLAEDILRYHG